MARNRSVKSKDETDEAEIVENIPGIDALKKEFLGGKMPERKLIALRVKLISLFKNESILEVEQELMETILKRQRNLGTILSHDNYLLNSIESERCEDICFVRTDDAPIVHHLTKNQECRYFYDAEYNDGKNKKDSVGRFNVYVPRVVPTDHQLSLEVARKELKGHPVDASEYPGPKTLIHRLSLRKTEFEAWFEVEDADILNAAPVEPEYKF